MITQYNIVKSLAGRDQNNLYVVSFVEGDYCYLVDGKTKPLTKPKRKKIKHIECLASAQQELLGVFDSKLQTNDAKIRKFLKEFQKSL